MESGHENGPPAGLPAQGPVRTALSAEAVGFEPTVTSLPRRFPRPFTDRQGRPLPCRSDGYGDPGGAVFIVAVPATCPRGTVMPAEPHAVLGVSLSQ